MAESASKRIAALDSIRGLLLLQMVLDHFGKPISYYLYQCFGFFSAAEGFFFLSGFVGMYAATSKQFKDPKQNWMVKRGCRIWIYHILTLTLMSLLAYLFLTPIQYLFTSIFKHPLEAIPLSLALIHTPEWMDILPLYVILMVLGHFVFPKFVAAKSKKQLFLFWLISFTLWGISQFGIRDLINCMFPHWVHHGVFNPFSWQLVYFTGAATAAWWKHLHKTEANLNRLKKLTIFALIPFLFCFLWSHQIIPLSNPQEFLTSRENLGILRFANFFLFVILISGIVRKWPHALDFKFTNTIGKQSLDVYSWHIVFLLLWFSFPKEIKYSSPWNVLAPLCTCILLWLIAKIRNIRQKKT